MLKKTKKNPTDVNLLARSVVEAAIGEPLTTQKPTKPVKKRRKKQATARH